MNELVPYVSALSRAGSRYAQYSPRMRGAYVAARTARYVYDNPRQAAYAAKVITRAAKRAFKFAKARTRKPAATKVGEEVSDGNAKRSQTVFEGPTLKDTRLMYSNDILDIPRGIQLNERSRDLINIRGFKLCMEVKSLLANVALTGNNLMFNLALVCPRNLTGVSTTGFFRYSNGDDRSVDFSTALTSTQFHCLPINPDKFHVLMHKRYQLGDSLNDRFSSHLMIDEYIKINRQFRYSTGTTSTPQNQLFLVYWADASLTAATTASVANAFQVSNTGIVYFKETCGC